MSRSAYKAKYGTIKCSHRIPMQSSSASSTSPCCHQTSSSSGSVESETGTEEDESGADNNKESVGSPSKCSTPPTSTCLTPSITTTPTSRADAGPEEDEKRRAAAAEARRRRRLVLTRRQNSTSPRRNTSRRGGSGGKVIVPFAGMHDRQRTRSTPSPARSTAPSQRCYPLIQPTVEGVENVATRWKNGWVVAIPTECTYEACLAVRLPPRTYHKQPFEGGTSQGWLQQVNQLREITKPPFLLSSSRCHEVKDPYCVVTPGCELRRHPILREVFAPRLYALRPSDVDKESVMCRFNENMEVLERLANKLWPGPILIRLGLPSNSPWTQTPFVVESRPPRIDENDPNINHHEMVYNNFVSLRCPRHPLAVKARKDVASNENSLLISLPVHHSPQSPITATPSHSSSLDANDTNGSPAPLSFCTRARQVVSRMAVLDGEDCREVFHVPTCEYGRPCESVLWVDGRQRVVTVQSASQNVVSCDERMVQAALRQNTRPKSQRTGNRKERMLMQAIISKWKVVTTTTLEEFSQA